LAKSGAGSPAKEVEGEEKPEEQEGEGGHDRTDPAADPENDEEDFAWADLDADGVKLSAGANAAGTDHPEGVAVDDELAEGAVPVVSELDELDSLLQSAGLGDAASGAGVEASDGAQLSEEPDAPRSASNGGGGGLPTTVAGMKALLRASGVGPAKLDSFLDRESLAEYVAALQEQSRVRAHSRARSNGSPLPPEDALPVAEWQPPPSAKPVAKPPKAPPVGNARAKGPLSAVVLLGELHSGLPWVAELFHLNAPGWKVCARANKQKTGQLLCLYSQGICSVCSACRRFFYARRACSLESLL
jgi:hypothetical protein